MRLKGLKADCGARNRGTRGLFSLNAILAPAELIPISAITGKGGEGGEMKKGREARGEA